MIRLPSIAALAAAAGLLPGAGAAAVAPADAAPAAPAPREIRYHGRPPAALEWIQLEAVRIHAPDEEESDLAPPAAGDALAGERPGETDKLRAYDSRTPPTPFVRPAVVTVSPKRSSRAGRTDALGLREKRRPEARTGKAGSHLESPDEETGESRNDEDEAIQDAVGGG
jgi:hypothetical protein